MRRSICDMSLLIFHLFLSSFTHDGVDVMMAQKIVDWNLKRYPEGNINRFTYLFVGHCTDRVLIHALPLLLNVLPYVYSRRILPARPGQAQLESQSACARDRVLSKGDERPKPISKLASSLVLGDGCLASRPLGNRRITQVLAQSPQGVHCTHHYTAEGPSISEADVPSFFFARVVVVKGGLRVRCRGPSRPTRRRSEPSRRAKAHEGSTETAPTHRGQVDTARKIRRPQSAQMRSPSRQTRPPRPRTHVHTPRRLSRAPLRHRGADVAPSRSRSCGVRAVRRQAGGGVCEGARARIWRVLGRLVFGATSGRRVFALHRVSCTYNHIRHWEAKGLPTPSNLYGGVA